MCPDLEAAPPNVLLAMSLLTTDEWLFPLVALCSCGLFSALLLWRIPQWAQASLVRRLCAGSLMLVIAAYLHALSDSWGQLLVGWHSQRLSQPGFMTCQLTQLDSEFYRAESTSEWATMMMLALIFLAGLVLAGALKLHRTARAAQRLQKWSTEA